MPGKGKQFEKGNPGRPLGTPNKITKTIREVVLETFNKLQDNPKANLLTWAEAEPTEFYKIASKLIPMEIHATVNRKRIVVLTPKRKAEIEEARIATDEPANEDNNTPE